MLQSGNALFLCMLSFLQKYFCRHKERAERHHRWKHWLHELKLRTEAQFQLRWATENLSPAQAQAIKDIPRIMGLRGAKLFPSDDIFLILYNPHADFRNVEAMQYIADKLHINFPDIYEKYHAQGLSLIDFLKG